MWYKNLGGTVVHFVTIHAVTDGRTPMRSARPPAYCSAVINLYQATFAFELANFGSWNSHSMNANFGQLCHITNVDVLQYIKSTCWCVTVKGVNFYGPRSEYVVSGSDCGNVYLWHKNTACVVNYFHADDGGVVSSTLQCFPAPLPSSRPDWLLKFSSSSVTCLTVVHETRASNCTVDSLYVYWVAHSLQHLPLSTQLSVLHAMW